MEKFSRTASLIGKDNLTKLQKSTVAVFGLGGVGGVCLECLARSGIGSLVVFDGDVVSKSNTNRQIIALNSTVGKDKTEVFQERLKDINPDVNVEAHKIFYLPENAESVDFSKFDYVVDAVDTVSAKLEIITRCIKANVKVISSMGTGGKLDISTLKVEDIYKTKNCPLAKVMRRELKERGVENLKVVYSEEVGVKAEKNEGEKFIPSMMFVPATAGLMLAREVVLDLIKE